MKQIDNGSVMGGPAVTCPPRSLQDWFSNLSKFDKKMVGGEPLA